jgi:hypothetical protein
MKMKKQTWLVVTLVIASLGDARADEPAKTDATPPRVIATKPAPLTRVQGAKWEPALGLVAEQEKDAQEASAARDEPASLPVPAIGSTSLTEFNVRVFAGFDQIAGNESVSPLVGAALRYEARHVDSLLAPWAEGGFSTTIYDATPRNELDDESAFNWDFWLRGGVDVHPLRERFIGVGPWFGYRQLHLRALETSRIVQGVDVGGQIHLRTKETASERPGFDAIAYGFVQGAGLADQSNRTFLGALLSAGSDFRAYAQLEGCASSPDSCFPRQVRAVAGLGGVF